MKKNLVLKISFILILTIMFSMNVMAKSVTIRDNPVPLAGGVFEFDSDEDTAANPKTGDNMLLLIILAGIALPAASAVGGIMKKSRAK